MEGHNDNIPHNDDDKVQQVPAVADVGAGVHDQTVGQNFQKGFYSEDDQKDVLHLFLDMQWNKAESSIWTILNNITFQTITLVSTDIFSNTLCYIWM